jgi:hypothetical protein
MAIFLIPFYVVERLALRRKSPAAPKSQPAAFPEPEQTAEPAWGSAVSV